MRDLQNSFKPSLLHPMRCGICLQHCRSNTQHGQPLIQSHTENFQSGISNCGSINHTSYEEQVSVAALSKQSRN